MLVYDLSIDYGFGQLGLNTYKGDVKSKTNINGFQIEATYPRVDLQVDFPHLEDIDMRQCRTDMGQPSLRAASLIWRDEAMAYIIDYIGQKAQEGDLLGAIEKDVSVIDIIESESFPESPEINVDAVPKTPPKITFSFGKVLTESRLGSVKVDVPCKPVTIEHVKAKVDISLEKNPYIEIKVVPKGKNIDKVI